MVHNVNHKPAVGHRNPAALLITPTARAPACRWQTQRLRARAEALQACVRVAPHQPIDTVMALLLRLFSPQDSVETIRTLCIGAAGRWSRVWGNAKR